MEANLFLDIGLKKADVGVEKKHTICGELCLSFLTILSIFFCLVVFELKFMSVHAATFFVSSRFILCDQLLSQLRRPYAFNICEGETYIRCCLKIVVLRNLINLFKHVLTASEELGPKRFQISKPIQDARKAFTT